MNASAAEMRSICFRVSRRLCSRPTSDAVFFVWRSSVCPRISVLVCRYCRPTRCTFRNGSRVGMESLAGGETLPRNEHRLSGSGWVGWSRNASVGGRTVLYVRLSFKPRSHCSDAITSCGAGGHQPRCSPPARQRTRTTKIADTQGNAQCLVGVVPGESHAAGPHRGERADGTGWCVYPDDPRICIYSRFAGNRRQRFRGRCRRVNTGSSAQRD